MAFVPLVPANLNISVTQNAAQAVQSPHVTNFASANVNLSTWVGLQAWIITAAPNPAASRYSFGTVTADATGIVTIQIHHDDFALRGAGTARYYVVGQPTAGDELQLLVSGILVVNPG